MIKNLPAGDTRDAGSIPELGSSPGEEKWQPTPVFLPEKFHGQRSLVVYSPWSCKELDIMTKQQQQRLKILFIFNKCKGYSFI